MVDHLGAELGRGAAERKQLLFESFEGGKRRGKLTCPAPPSFSASAVHQPKILLMRLSMGEVLRPLGELHISPGCGTTRVAP